ncbi:hypothetical protein [Bradyrhizobium sp. DASA03007]|uniref:hypothetical protein n=1 Tax=unclassified Bradyrhizobium TaxID=2631580 RepID=UPI003F723D18
MSGFVGNGPNGVGRFARFQFSAAARQATFGGTDKNGLTLRYTPGQVEVSLDGSWLSPDDYIATDGSTITLSRGANAGDTLYVFAPTNFGVADSVSFLAPQQLSAAQQGLAAANLGALSYSVVQATTAVQQAIARANAGITKKNYIINGGMQISQENGTTAVTAVGSHPVDQFAMRGNTLPWSAAQVASPTPGGSPNRIRVTSTSAHALAAGDLTAISQSIEGQRCVDLKFGQSGAKNCVLQFGVKAPAGTYCITVQNSASTRSYVAEYTISAGQANTDIMVSIPIPGDIAGTWNTDNTAGIIIWWTLTCGSSFQGPAGSWQGSAIYATSNQFNLLAANGSVFELFDVGLYEGNAAPPFQLPDYAGEISLCKRYWQQLQSWVVDTGVQVFSTVLPVKMRATPTFTGGAAGFAANGFTDGQSGYFSQTSRGAQTINANARL